MQQNSSQSERNQRNLTQHLLARIRSLTTRVVIYGSISIFLIGGILVAISYAPFFPSSSDLLTGLIRGLGEGLMTGIIITGFFSFLVIRYPEKVRGDIDKLFTQDVRSKLTTLQKDVTTQTKELTTLQKDATAQTKQLTTGQEDAMAQMKQMIALLNSTKGLIDVPDSMKVLDGKGISRVYESRSEAVEDMILDVRDQVTHIRIMGISLSSLIRYRDSRLYKVWDEITKYVKSNVDQAHPRSSRLEIKVLLIDPECLGAQLRSRWESAHPQHPGRLSTLVADVLLTAQTLQDFMKTIPTSPEAGISFEVRLYRLPPQLFLLSTDKVSYVMPYYFWRGAEDMPLFKLANIEAQLSQGMYDHFDLIWQKASISLEQFLEEHHVGLDKGMYECGAINVYDSLEKARKRILHLLGNVEERVYIQGISLNSTLGGIDGSQPDDLLHVIGDLVRRGKEVKILLLDPESEQAKFRAFREWCLQKRQPDTFKQYQKQASEKLYWDTNETIRKLAALQYDLLHQNAKIDTLSIMKYDAAPCCFMFLVDNTVLVEQYIYGIVTRDRPNGQSPSILGGEMPLVEYVSQPGDLYEARPDKRVFEMMKDHFNFVFKHYAHPIEGLVTAPDNVKQPSSA